MRVARFDGGRIGIVQGDRIHDITAVCGVDPAGWPPTGMIRTIAGFAAIRPEIDRVVASSAGLPLAGVRLETPVAWPHKLLALPANFRAHAEEMSDFKQLAADEAGFFMKSPGALSGAADPIVIPNRPGRMFHHECEMAIIIGKTGRRIPVADATSYIFGYACLIDVTMRGKEERDMRKSFDTFCPVGPWITTSDEVGPTDDIVLRLWVNGELRQQAPAREMVVGIREAVANCSAVTTLQPGDIIATGTMAGVGPLLPGDTVRIEIDRVGGMTLAVIADPAG
jgi:2-keto-4-pentenoate hydratase/2-oxohepta-3-ene-1,7-dioic acid hydratase in catechol pathway